MSEKRKEEKGKRWSDEIHVLPVMSLHMRWERNTRQEPQQQQQHILFADDDDYDYEDDNERRWEEREREGRGVCICVYVCDTCFLSLFSVSWCDMIGWHILHLLIISHRHHDPCFSCPHIRHTHASDRQDFSRTRKIPSREKRRQTFFPRRRRRKTTPAALLPIILLGISCYPSFFKREKNGERFTCQSNCDTEKRGVDLREK